MMTPLPAMMSGFVAVASRSMRFLERIGVHLEPGPMRRQIDGDVPVRHAPRLLGVLADIDEHRARPAGAGEVKRFLEDVGNSSIRLTR